MNPRKRPELSTLTRNLLIDRFGLVAHQEKKDVAGFSLRVDAGGHRLVTAKGERTTSNFNGRRN